MSYLAAISATIIVVLGLVLVYVLSKIEKERTEWKAERRFLTDRAIARHVGEVLALDRMDDKRENGEPQQREHVPTLPEGL